MSRAVRYENSGGPEVLQVVEVEEPHAGPGQVRVRVTAAGLNPMDWMLAADSGLAAMFGVTMPAGFGADYAGTVDEVGDGVADFVIGDRVYGIALAAAVADFVVATPGNLLWPTPDGLADEVAATLPTAGLTAAATLDVVGVGPGDTVLIGGAAGGVGIFAVQLAALSGAKVVGTAAPGTFEFLEQLGAQPVAYGAGLADRVRDLGVRVTAAIDLFGTEVAEAALELGVAPERISTIAAGPNPPGGVRATGRLDAPAGALERIAGAVVEGRLTVPIAAAYPVEQIRDAVAEQASRHVHGKVVVTL